jgi:hypothetical protein
MILNIWIFNMRVVKENGGSKKVASTNLLGKLGLVS